MQSKMFSVFDRLGAVEVWSIYCDARMSIACKTFDNLRAMYPQEYDC